MKHFRIITALFLLSASLLSCDKNQPQAQKTVVTNDADIYEIVNLLLEDHKDEPVGNKCLVGQLTSKEEFPGNFAEDLKKNNSFSPDDKHHMLQQANDTTPFIVERALLRKDVKILPQDTLDYLLEKYVKHGKMEQGWNNVKKNYGEVMITISKPLFTKDRKQAIVTVERSRGPLSSHGYKCYLRKTNAGWEISKTTISWIS